jgi:hypothetical protein
MVVRAKKITNAYVAPVFGQKFYGVCGEARIAGSLLVCLWFSVNGMESVPAQSEDMVWPLGGGLVEILRRRSVNKREILALLRKLRGEDG